MAYIKYVIRLCLMYFRSLYLNLIGRKTILCQCWVAGVGETIRKNNWGDDLNKFFFEYITGSTMQFMPSTRWNFPLPKRYILIGSILNFYFLNNAIVYGSGVLNPEVPTRGKPKKIISVRGPLTREYLISNGIDCPQCYGDPVLLLPYFYRPIKSGRHITVIPHYVTENTENAVLAKFREQGFKILSMRNYENWTDIIDDICESSLVLSESLHGLIVAEAYGIPSIWVEFTEHKSTWSFKYQDFYCSIGKCDMHSYKFYKHFELDDLLRLKDEWKPGSIDFQTMLDTFPFTVKRVPLNTAK